MSTPLTTQQAVDLYTTMRKIRRFEETVKAHIGKEIVEIGRASCRERV